LQLSATDRHPIGKNNLRQLSGRSQAANILPKYSGIHPQTISVPFLEWAQNLALFACSATETLYAIAQFSVVIAGD